MDAALPTNAAADTDRKHIVDVLIEERAPRLSGSAVWPIIRPLLYRMLDYGKAVRMADAIAPMPGRAAMEHVSDLLSVKVEVSGLDRIPKSGRLVIVCNHPTGIADGVAVYDALKGVRPDIVFFANSDAHRVSPGLDEVLIPVEWVEGKRTRERTRLTLQMARDAFEAERPLMIFPAGRLARVQGGILTDPEWQSSALSLARKYEAPIVPLHLSGPNAFLFHLFDRVSQELRDITLFHELLNKQGRRYRLTVGRPIMPDCFGDMDADAATLAVKTYVERSLPFDPDRGFVCG